MILLFTPMSWAGLDTVFLAVAGNLPFLVSDMVFLSVSVCLLRQELLRVSQHTEVSPKPAMACMQPQPSPSGATGAH